MATVTRHDDGMSRQPDIWTLRHRSLPESPPLPPAMPQGSHSCKPVKNQALAPLSVNFHCLICRIDHDAWQLAASAAVVLGRGEAAPPPTAGPTGSVPCGPGRRAQHWAWGMFRQW